MAGKGDDPRPFSVPREEYERKYDNIRWSSDKPQKKKPRKPKS